MRCEKETIRWILNIADTKFTIYDIEGGKFNLCFGEAGVVLHTYNSAEAAAVALSSFVNDSRVEHLLRGKIIPENLSYWSPEGLDL